MEDSVVQRFLEYKPPQSPKERHAHSPRGQRPPQTYSPTSPLRHYRFPNQPFQRSGGMACSPSPAASATSDSSVHQPTARPHSGPKAKFTLEDDALLLDLKEKHEMTWKKISEFFPGRTSGTLQVRYCTKLKAKGVAWTDELVGRLKHALHEYEKEKWRIVSTKVGHGFSAAACKQKAEELEEEASRA